MRASRPNPSPASRLPLRSPAGLLLAALSMAAAALPAQNPPAESPAAASPSAGALPAFRVLVLPADPDAAASSDRAVTRLAEAIRAGGLDVVDRTQAMDLMARQQATMQTLLNDRGQRTEASQQGPAAQLALAARCDLVVRVGVERTRMRKQQGRYTIRLRGGFQAAFADTAASIGSGEAQGSGRSLDSYGEAESMALGELMDPSATGSLAGQLLAALNKARNEEATRGPALTIALFAPQPLAELVGDLGTALASLDGVQPASHKALATFPTGAFHGDNAGICQEVALRCTGGIQGIQQGLLPLLRTRAKEMEQAEGTLLRPLFLASGRRLEVILRTSPQEVALADEVERVVQDAVATLYRRYGDALAGQRLAVLPASIGVGSAAAAKLNAFQRGFRQAYDAAERRLQEAGKADGDPLTGSGSVQIQGQVFADLAAARDHLFQLEEAFQSSPAGDLALTISGLVQSSLAKTSEGAVRVQPMAQARDRAVDYIRLEAAAATEDGAIDPESVAFYTQDGTQLLISTRLRPFLDEFALTVNVIDLRSGLTMQGNTSFHPRFTEPLRASLGG